MSVMISSLVFPRREYGGNTPLGVPAAIQVKSVVIREFEIWGCYTYTLWCDFGYCLSPFIFWIIVPRVG